MRSVRSLLGSVLLLLTLVMFCGVPAFPQDAPDVAMGMNPQATYHSNDFDFIDTATGRLNFHIPLVVDHSQRGKLNFTYSLTFTSTGTWNLIYDSRNVPRIEPPKYGVSSAAFVTDGLLGAPIGEGYTDGSGRTNLALSVPEGAWGAGPLHPLGDVETIDGSGIFSSYNTNRNQLVNINRQGVQFHYPTGWPWPAEIEDANGNVIAFSGGSTSTMTDTLGRTWTRTYNLSSDVSGCPFGGPVAPIWSTIWTIPGPANVSNGLRTFKFCYSWYYIYTHFNAAGVEYTASESLMTGVVLPNGTTWRFDYDNNSFGDLIAVYPPTGGSISYTWTTSDASRCSNYGFGTRTVASRTVSDGTNSHKWTYIWTIGSPASTYTATDPLGNNTVYTATLCSGLVNQIQYYSGSATSGNLLKTVAKSYRSLPDPYPGDVTEWWVPSPALLTSTTTTWPNGQQSQVQLTYDSGFTFTDTNHDHNGPRTYTSSYGLVTAESHNDYGNGAPGPVLSTTNTNYLALSNSSYVTANLLDLPSSVIATAGNGNKCAETDYGYDASAQIVSSGITEQHVSAPSSVRGDLTSITRQLYANPCQSASPTGTPLTTKRYIYDTGMLQKSVDPLNNPTTYAYSSTYFGAFPTTVTNALNQSTTYGYDFNTGLLTSIKDPNNQPTSFMYDNMLRPVSASYPDGGLQTVAFRDVYPFNATLTKKMTSSQNLVTRHYFDGLGRVYATQLTSDTQGVVEVDTSYDALGRKSTVSNPYRSSADQTYGITTYHYDAMNRVTTIAEPDGSGTTNEYCGNATLMVDEQNNWRRNIRDGLGRMIELDEPTSLSSTRSICAGTGGPVNVTTYGYDALDNLTGVSQAGSRPRTFVYNSLSQLTSATNPESGTVTYGYDSDGNMTSKTAPKPNQASASVTVTTGYTYDALNRLTQKSYSDGSTPSAFFTYDGPTNGFGVPVTNVVGRLTEEWAGTSCCATSQGEIFSYDPMGRILLNTQYTPTLSYRSVNYTYDLAGNMLTASNGMGVTISYSYFPTGWPFKVTSSLVDSQHPATLASVGDYWPNGALQQVTLGNGASETWAYNNRFQPCRMNVNSGAGRFLKCTDTFSGTILDYTYGYAQSVGNNGNLTSWTATGTQAFTRSYSYDQVNRLAGMSDTASAEACKGLQWTYDIWGNRTDQTPTSGSCGASHLSFDSNNRITTSGFTYDAAGNLTHDASHSYTYDAENRLVTVDGGTTATYTYDAEGRRARKILGGVTYDRIHDLSGNVVAEFYGTGWGPGYVYLNGEAIAEYANGTTYFLHHDHLGSTRLMTAMNQSVYDSLDYMPFGEQITGDTGTTHKFTGKERDSESGLDNFTARYFGSTMGRFMSPDSPSYSNHKNPQSWNLYAFALNNPVTFRDADGHKIDCANNTPQCRADAAASTANAQAAARVTTQTTTTQHSFLGIFHWTTSETQIAIKGDINSFRALSPNASKLADLVTSKDTITVHYDNAFPGGWTYNGSALNGGSTSRTATQGFDPQAWIDPSRTPGAVYDQDAVDQGIRQANTGEEFGHEVLGHIWGEMFGGAPAGTRANMRDSIIGENAVRALDPTRGQKGLESHHNYNEMPPQQ